MKAACTQPVADTDSKNNMIAGTAAQSSLHPFSKIR